MGHSEFDLERMKAARNGTGPSFTLDGVSITASIDVGGHVRLVPECTEPANPNQMEFTSRMVLRLQPVDLVSNRLVGWLLQRLESW